jgi:hypothetical protein
MWRTEALLRYLPRARCLFSALSRVHSRCSFSYRRSSDLIYDHLNLIVPVLYFPHSTSIVCARTLSISELGQMIRCL